MSIRSSHESRRRKLIGITHQQHCRDLILEYYPELEPDDVISTPPSVHGADLTLSPKAKKILGNPSYEMKADKRGFKGVYNAVAQARRQAQTDETPLVVLTDHSDETARTLLVLDFEAWLYISRMFYLKSQEE